VHATLSLPLWHTLFTGQRDIYKEIEKQREKERESGREREKERESGRDRE
jgi:hypothetical protein